MNPASHALNQKLPPLGVFYSVHALIVCLSLQFSVVFAAPSMFCVKLEVLAIDAIRLYDTVYDKELTFYSIYR